MSTEETLIAICDAAVVEDLTTELETAGATVESSRIRHLDGDVAQQAVVLVGIVTPAAAAILDALRRFLTRNHATVKVGDIEFKNARPEDVEMFMKAIRPPSE